MMSYPPDVQKPKEEKCRNLSVFSHVTKPDVHRDGVALT